MPDDIISENLFLITKSIDLVLSRFEDIHKPDDFVLDDNGVTILDSISMRLQVVGELLKKIEKADNSFLNNYDEINWENIMRLRDIVSHHYVKVDHEIIYDICQNHLPQLKITIQKMLK
jgi:uncharacterized protein with HEPN domain